VVTHPSIKTGLGGAIGAAAVADGSPECAIDGRVPALVARPADYASVQETLRFAARHRLAVMPLGGRRHVSLGNNPQRYDIALDLSALAAVVEFEPADLTITVQAGMTLGALREATAEVGLVVPFDPSAPGEATVGGMIAAAVDGPARMSLGIPRDFTSGLRVVTADGRLTRAGGKVVKNVAGYDLCKLYTGSLGTLGVMVEASLKALPVPPAAHSVSFALASAEVACAVVGQAVRAGLSVRSAILHPDAGRWRLTADLAGTRAGVDRTARELTSLAGCAAEEAQQPPRLEGELLARFALLPAALPGLLDDIVHEFPGGSLEAWPASGVALLCPDAADGNIGLVQAVARRHGASLVFQRCPARIKEIIDVFGDAPAAIDTMRRVKQEFDPAGILSPGRAAGRV
jgi:glycolate oxidase FAD binding subunit